jgi:hypothetical protein
MIFDPFEFLHPDLDWSVRKLAAVVSSSASARQPLRKESEVHLPRPFSLTHS